MRRIFLSTFSVSFSPRNKPKEKFPLGEVGDTGLSASQILGRYIKSKIGVQENHTERSKTLTIGDMKTDRGGDLLHGSTKGGEYGFTSEATDIDTGRPAWRRTPKHVENIPYYYCLSLPAAQTRGVLVLQRFGLSGIKETFVSRMKEFIKDAYPDLRLHVKPLSLGDVLDEYLRSAICSEVTLISTKMPKDYAERIKWVRQAEQGLRPKSDEAKGSLELTFKSSKLWKMTGFKERIKKIRAKELEVRKLIELDDFDYDQAAVTLEMGNRRKKFLLSQEEFARTYMDITDDCRLTGGHPNLEDVHREALTLIDGLDHIV